MCKIEDILNTEIRMQEKVNPVKQGMTSERVRFNTDVMFAVAKQLEMPLDKTSELMRRKNMFQRLHRGFAHRHSEGVAQLSKTISKALLES